MMALPQYYSHLPAFLLKAFYLLVACLCLPATLTAQKENNTWYFGVGVGLDFNTTPPTPLTNGAQSAVEGCASVSDANGQLLFYTNGVKIYDRRHTIMPNGDSLKSGSSSTQGAVIVKKPGSNTLYYVFSAECNTCGVGFEKAGFHYSIVDITQNGGYGAVIKKNVQLLFNESYEKLTAVKDAAGCGFWIITHDAGLGRYYTFHLTSSGVDPNPVISQIGFSMGTYTAGALKASPNGKKLAAAFNLEKRLEMLDFDNLTGKISNCIVIDSASLDDQYYGVSFSPNNRFLYASTEIRIFQFDIINPAPSAIRASKVELVYSPHSAFRAIYTALQTGPDNRIYVATWDNNPHIPDHSIGFIQFPNNKGLACGFRDRALQISNIVGKYPFNGLPALIENTIPFNSEFDLGPDTVLCAGQQYLLNGAQHITGNFTWNTGETGKTITVNQTGLYKVSISTLCGTFSDSVTVKIGKPFPVYLGNDTAFCGPFRHLLDAGKGAKNYLWSTGDTTVTLLVNSPDIYAVAVKDSNSCNAGDTIDIGQLNSPVIDLKLDTVTCDYVSLSVPRPDSAIQYQWSTGDTGLNIKVTQKGIYSITFSNKFCSISTSIPVNILPTPDVDLGPDTSICEGNPIILTASDGEKHLWNTKDTGNEITVFKEGWYSVTATRNNCSATDSVWVGPVCDMWYYIPTAFTPGKDAKNDVFEVVGEYYKKVDMMIFDRWGGLVYDGSGLNPSWDGTVKSVSCADGVYMYLITVTGYKNGLIRKESHRGNVTLLR